MKIKEILNKGIKILNENGIEEASLIAKMFLAHICKCKKEELIINSEKEIDEKEFFEGIERLKKGYPVQYLIGYKEFMKMNFKVNEDVLIPRSDTEILVEEAISIVQKEGKKDILELCTGSGAISVSLAKYLKNVNILGTDISEDALKIARENSASLLELNDVKFIQSDMFEKINRKFDLIVSNPPYIKSEVIKKYNLEYEPKLALDRRKRWTCIL